MQIIVQINGIMIAPTQPEAFLKRFARCAQQFNAAIALLGQDHTQALTHVAINEDAAMHTLKAVKYVNAAIAEDLHRLYTGIKNGVKDAGLLDAALNAPKQAGFGVEFFPSIEHKAAKLVQGIAGNHVFHDGNKRGAWSIMIEFLMINGFNVDCSPEHAQSVVLDLVTHKITEDDFAYFIADHIW